MNKITVIIWSDEAEHGKLILGKSTSMYFITQYLPTEDNEIEVRGSFQIDLNTLLTKMKKIEGIDLKNYLDHREMLLHRLDVKIR